MDGILLVLTIYLVPSLAIVGLRLLGSNLRQRWLVSLTTLAFVAFVIVAVLLWVVAAFTEIPIFRDMFGAFAWHLTASLLVAIGILKLKKDPRKL